MFKHVHYTEVPAEKVEAEGAAKASIRWLISETDGAANFAMRVLEFEAGGHSPYHAHDWEHEVFILEGNGYLTVEGEEHPFKPGDVVFLPPGTNHNFTAGDQGLKMICLVPVGCR